MVIDTNLSRLRLLPRRTYPSQSVTLSDLALVGLPLQKTMLVQNSILEENMADLRAKAERSAYRRPKSREELRWRKAVFVNCAVDLVAVLYMSYLVRAESAAGRVRSGPWLLATACVPVVTMKWLRLRLRLRTLLATVENFVIYIFVHLFSRVDVVFSFEQSC